MAVILKLPYVLIDAEWNQMKGCYTIDDAIDYARSGAARAMSIKLEHCRVATELGRARHRRPCIVGTELPCSYHLGLDGP